MAEAIQESSQEEPIIFTRTAGFVPFFHQTGYEMVPQPGISDGQNETRSTRRNVNLGAVGGNLTISRSK